jgi:DNA-binding LacI/PurR family transcriptional regulator
MGKSIQAAGKRSTMKQIAEKLGCSINTVSLVLNNKSGVGDEMRRAVLDEAEKSGYLDQKSGKYNQSIASMEICVITKKRYFNDNYFYANVICGIQARAVGMGFDTLIHTDDNEGEVPNCIRTHKVSGIITVGEVSRQVMDELLTFGIPIVCADYTPYDHLQDSVLTDNKYGTYNATAYLMSNGFRKIGFFGDIHYSLSIKDRYWGYTEAVLHFAGESAGEKELYRKIIDYSVVGDIEEAVLQNDIGAAVKKLEALKELPEAFVCSNDRAAILLENALRRMGRKIPEDVSVIGFDDMKLCTMVEPKLTTLHVDADGMGRRATDLLIRRINEPKAVVEKVVIPVKLIIRDSVGQNK